MRILITGVTGFVGGHLAETLRDHGGELHGTSRSGRWPVFLQHLSATVRLHAVDWHDAAQIEAVLRMVSPDQIYHLAGYAATGASFTNADAAWAGNLGVAQSLFDALESWGGRPRMVFVTSALIYAPPDPADAPIDETGAISPLSPYAASKAAADRLAGETAARTGLEIVRVRPFNQIGPRQSPQFAVGSFSQQLARIERGLAPPRLETGDLSSRRDFTDVRDMARAYVGLMKNGRGGDVYNAGAGAAVALSDVVDWLRSACRVPVEVVTRTDRLRPADAPVLIADAAKLRAATDWSPEISLRRSVQDALDFWRRFEPLT